MYIIEDLKLVAHAGNMMRGTDGVFTKNGAYYITFLHGNMDGTLAFQICDRVIEVLPCELRDTISAFMDCDIPKNAFLYITPCFPLAVMERYKDNLIEENIEILGDWEDSTRWNAIIDNSYYETYNTVYEDKINGVNIHLRGYTLHVDASNRFTQMDLQYYYSGHAEIPKWVRII